MEMACDRILPFIGVNISSETEAIRTSVYHKPTDKGLLLHFHSHTDTKYKRSLVTTMITRAYRISSSWAAFHEECQHLLYVFKKLQYPATSVYRCINEILSNELSPKNSAPNSVSQPDLPKPIRMILPFKSEAVSRKLRDDLGIFNAKLGCRLAPVFTSTKLQQLVKSNEKKEEIIARACVVYKYTCTCDMCYIGYTGRHLHERVEEHRRPISSIHRHCKSSSHPFDETRFSVIAKCTSEFDCKLRESIEIYSQRPSLNGKDEYSCSILYRLRDL
jgi:hypothetical protein